MNASTWTGWKKLPIFVFSDWSPAEHISSVWVSTFPPLCFELLKVFDHAYDTSYRINVQNVGFISSLFLLIIVLWRRAFFSWYLNVMDLLPLISFCYHWILESIFLQFSLLSINLCSCMIAVIFILYTHFKLSGVTIPFIQL